MKLIETATWETGSKLLKAIRKDKSPAVSKNDRLMKKISRGDPVSFLEIEEFFDRVSLSELAWPWDVIKEIFRVQDDSIGLFKKPGMRDNASWGFSGITASRFVAGVVSLHANGIDVGCRAFVDAFRPTLMTRKVLTDEELIIWWAPRELSHMTAHTMRVNRDEIPPEDYQPSQKFTSKSTGYRIEVLFSSQDFCVNFRPARSVKLRPPVWVIR